MKHLAKYYLQTSALLLTFLSVTMGAIADEQALNLFTNASGWSDKKGVQLRLANRPGEEKPCTLDSLRLELSIGDGSHWKILTSKGPWKLNQTYTVLSKLNSGDVELLVNDKLVAKDKHAFVPYERTVAIGSQAPSWLNKGRPPYMVIQTLAELTTTEGKTVKLQWPNEEQLPMRLRLFQPSRVRKVKLAGPIQLPCVIKAVFKLIPQPDLRKLAPFVDQYGQAIAADYPSKIKNDDDLKKADQREKEWLQNNAVTGYDKFGGNQNLGWTEKATGFYQVTKRNGKWWLVTPEGNPCFYKGVCVVPGLTHPGTPTTNREFLFQGLPPKSGKFAEAWATGVWGAEGIQFLTFHTANMIRKYGAGWKQVATERTALRLNAWGFSGAGKWCGENTSGGQLESKKKAAYVGHLRLGTYSKIGNRPDVFDENARKTIEANLREQIIPHLNDPWVIGWSIGNEKHTMPHPEDILEMLQADTKTPVKRALIEYALNKLHDGNVAELSKTWKLNAKSIDDLCAAKPAEIPAADLEQLRCFFSDRYYAFFYQTVKKLDPNHLYLGSWTTPNWSVNDNDWNLIAPHCDVIGYDAYGDTFAPEKLLSKMKATNKPVLLGEFGLPQFYDGKRGFGRFNSTASASDAESGQKYIQNIKDAADNPWCVGLMWFLYRDQPLTGRGGKTIDTDSPKLVYGEHYAFGLVDVADNPKWDLIKSVREANLAADQWRSQAVKRGK